MPEAIIVGGGVSGLCCAIELHRAGVPFQLLESQEAVGGRIRTDRVGGFLCDRGFQILLTAYPEAVRFLDYDALDLRAFYPGALVRVDGGFHRVADPFRRPLDALRAVRSPVGSLADKARVLKMRSAALSGDLEDLYSRPQSTTLDRLQATGFSERMIERFFRPFLAGVFLESELATSSRKLEFVFRMFAQGDNALPARGMEAIPQQLASRLPAESIRTGLRVERVEPGKVVLSSGEVLPANAVVVATGVSEVSRLVPCFTRSAVHGASCVYFASERPPIKEPILVLNGTGEGPVNNLCVPSEVAPGYAPDGQSLISVSVLGANERSDDQLIPAVMQQMRDWFGPQAETWQHLKTYRIAQALPVQSPEALENVEQASQVEPGLFVCGDHRQMASINGAMASGRAAALDAIRYLAS